MKPGSVRTSIDIPKELHGRLRAAAAKKGCSARQLILQGIERTVGEAEPSKLRRRLSLETAIVPARSKPFDLTYEEIYEHLQFP
jgi:hypothetical protein